MYSFAVQLRGLILTAVMMWGLPVLASVDLSMEVTMVLHFNLMCVGWFAAAGAKTGKPILTGNAGHLEATQRAA